MTKYKLEETSITPPEVADEVAINPRLTTDDEGHDRFAQRRFDSIDENMQSNSFGNSMTQNGHCTCQNNRHKQSISVLPMSILPIMLQQSCVDNNSKCLGCADMHQPRNGSAKSVSGILRNGSCRRYMSVRSDNMVHSSECGNNGDGNPENGATSICMGTCKDDSSHNVPGNLYEGRGSNENMMKSLISRARRACTLKMLRKRVPIVAWLPLYTPQAGVSDLIAGVTVGLTVIPQAIAYANVAGLPPQYGLYSSFMACFIYTIFGSCKDSPIGPTAIAAILTRENLHDLGPEFAVLLCFLSGCVELLMGILQLGFLIDFISGPVSVGFTSAAAIIIATTQVKDVLGLSFPGGKFLQVWKGLFQHIGETRLWDAVLGFSCIAVLLGLRKIKDILPAQNNQKEDTAPKKSIISKILWFLATSRNILVVVVCAAIAYYFELRNQSPFVLTGHVKPGLPNVTLPPFESTVGNRTYSFIDMASSMSSAIFVVPLLSILENIALAKVFSDGKPVDATQEMLAIGLCNIASSFVSSMPVSGALSRGAVNNASGVKTTFGGVYTGIIVLLSLQFFTPYFYYIPKASLAAVIIAAVIFMVELHVFKPIWRTKKVDLIPAIVTFISCLVIRLEIGIFIGISMNLLFLLYASARPSVHVNKTVSIPSGIEYLVITPDRSLVFPSVEYVRGVVSKAGIRQALSKMPVVLDATHIQCVDFTAAKGMKSLIDDFNARGQPLIFYNLKPSIVEVFQGLRPTDFKYCRCPAALDSMLQDVSPDNLTKF